ncbi:Uma2 family endonuclease [Streptomyces violens]|uniref:Uma2 family endonuclease n=1 Tax=Streptomyces violens TaxID=66377 RepID=UPI00069167BC|nr:Uma2 family endonuclease [Streptomyces violens]
MTLTHHETAGAMSPIEDPHALLRFLEDLPELDQLKIELIDGKIVIQASAAPFHNLIVGKLTVQFMLQGWEALPDQALISPNSSFEPKADLTVTTLDAMSDNKNPFPADRVELVVEIVSSDKDVDYIKKRFWYGTSKIPLYLVIDPNIGMCSLHSQPQAHGYRTVTTSEFGEPIELPEPFSFAIDTTTFKLYPPKA